MSLSGSSYPVSQLLSSPLQNLSEQKSKKDTDSRSEEIRQLNNSLQNILTISLASSQNRENMDKSMIVVENLIKNIGNGEFLDSKTLSDSYYLIGVFFMIKKKYNESIRFLNLTIRIKERKKDYDGRFTNALYNLGISYNGLGDFKKLEEYSLKSLEIDKEKFGESSPSLIGSYSSLAIAYIELQKYEKAISYSNIALAIADINPDKVLPATLADIYSNIGVCYCRLADFSKAKIYLDKSESIIRPDNSDKDRNFINLMNSQAIAYGALGLTEKSNVYYEKGIKQAISNNSSIANNIVNNYALILGKSGKGNKGKDLILDALKRAKVASGENSRTYYEVLSNYADYLRENNIDNKKSIECYLKCMDYLTRNPHDLLLKYPVIIGYSLSLAKAGEPQKAFETIQELLNKDYNDRRGKGIYENPEIESIKPDKKSLQIFKTKYEILWDLYRLSPDLKILEAASNTSELIVSLLEKVRINISEEDSRLVLGDRYRDSYFKAIRDFNLLYTKTADYKYLEKAFEYSEKSKVAGLLASTRELKAVQFHIPPDVAEFELRLKRDISVLNERIAEETGKEDADFISIRGWNEKLLESTRLRDSLILVFEHKYPGYYSIKYNSNVASINDIPEIVGRNGNYINYLLSDTVLYIFVVNRKHNQFLAIPVDTTFFGNIIQFRSLLSMPAPTEDAVAALKKYQTTGFALYKALIEPIRPYLISDKIIISPDNILSYLPFETIPVYLQTEGNISYRNLPYLMDDFDISYAYSATFLAETKKETYGFDNLLIAFAPNYPEPLDIQSVLMSRQIDKGVLPDLPYARQEAEFVTNITGGKLFEYSDAKESTYKAESGKYAIIHLAMHTLLNDKDPMRSTLIFSPEADSLEDRYLKTYEVYGIPLKAKMVVLSSCNTGNGLLYSGEGILSLARGFIYSGSQSVVMSMWEIEDKSGTEIVQMFYTNLKRGYSKSNSLRKARITYLKNANQLRSHPYFWSALIVYGNNAPLYYTRYLIIAAALVITFITIFFIFYFRSRKYS